MAELDVGYQAEDSIRGAQETRRIGNEYKEQTQQSTTERVTAQKSTEEKRPAQHDAARQSTAQHNTTEHSKAQHSTKKHSRAQPGTPTQITVEHIPAE